MDFLSSLQAKEEAMEKTMLTLTKWEILKAKQRRNSKYSVRNKEWLSTNVL